MPPRLTFDGKLLAELFLEALSRTHGLAEALAAQALARPAAPAAPPSPPYVPSAPAPPAYMVPSLSQVCDYKRKGEVMAVFPGMDCQEKVSIRPERMRVPEGPPVRTPLQVAFMRYDEEWKKLEGEWSQLVERLSVVLGPEPPTGKGPEPTRGIPGGSDLVRHVEAKADDVEGLAERVMQLRSRLEV